VQSTANTFICEMSDIGMRPQQPCGLTIKKDACIAGRLWIQRVWNVVWLAYDEFQTEFATIFSHRKRRQNRIGQVLESNRSDHAIYSSKLRTYTPREREIRGVVLHWSYRQHVSAKQGCITNFQRRGSTRTMGQESRSGGR
jgi:hypothetical protein